MNRSKDDADAVGLEGLRRVCEAVSIPVVSIGGVTAGNAGETMREGAVGVAVISAIFGRSDVKEAAKELRDAVERALWAEWPEDAFRGGLCVRRSDGWSVCLIH